MKQKSLITFREPYQDDYKIKQEIKEGNFTLIPFPDIAISIEQLINPT